MGSRPLVTIGVIAYNEDRFIRQSLEALLAQDFTDFEIVISDNASTDRTGEICREFAARDPRVQYCPTSENIGSIANFSRAATLGAGEYFMLACGHDLWHPRFLSSCLSVLRESPSVVLAYTDYVSVDENGATLMEFPHQVDTRGMTLRRRYGAVLWRLNCVALCGVFCRRALAQVVPMKPVIGPDNLLLAELGLLGDIACVPERLFQLRVFRTYADLPASFKRLVNRGWSLWRIPALLWQFSRAMLAMVGRRAPTSADRFWLSATTILRVLKLSVGYTTTAVGAVCFPRLHRRLMAWLVRRESAGAARAAGSQASPTARPRD
jgi:glycosyltransferase involved in cell wall biosynthesis